MDVSTPAGVATIRAIGGKYGWRKTEAFSEWWHYNYAGGYKGGNPGPGGGPAPLRRGSRGKRVKMLQKRLRRMGHKDLRADGDFGRTTYNKLREFQRHHGLKADGVYGQTTDKRLKAALKGREQNK